MKQPHVSLLKHAVRVTATCAMLLTLTADVGAAGPDGFWLVTPEEAAMAPVQERPGAGKVEVSREPPDTGPVIEVLKPTEGAVPTVPMEVTIRFTPRSAPVDMATLQVAVVKFITIDITDRVRPYVSPAGIQIPDAKLPSGKHIVRISVGDASGGMSNKQMTVSIP